jgi:NAD(P)-dependent dehydrogenase (short-subunit alcohol dehydrogenase family)
MEKCVALIAGASGIVGRAMLQHLEELPDWRAIGVSRRPPDLRTRARLLSLDLLDGAECERVLCGLSDVTHVFYTAFNQLESLAGEVAANVSMLRNVVEVVERCAPGLEHVQLMQAANGTAATSAPIRRPRVKISPGIPYRISISPSRIGCRPGRRAGPGPGARCARTAYGVSRSAGRST